jgi:hypothetical protein
VSFTTARFLSSAFVTRSRLAARFFCFATLRTLAMLSTPFTSPSSLQVGTVPLDADTSPPPSLIDSVSLKADASLPLAGVLPSSDPGMPPAAPGSPPSSVFCSSSLVGRLPPSSVASRGSSPGRVCSPSAATGLT